MTRPQHHNKQSQRFLVLLLFVVASCTSNTVPEINAIDPQTLYVGQRHDLTIWASDGNSDQLTFAYRLDGIDISSRARLVSSGQSALFSWSPIASDIGDRPVYFSVSDGKSSSSATASFTIKAATDADTSPYFRKPLGNGLTFDPAEGACIDLDIEVKDPDSDDVTIVLQKSLPEIALEKTGPWTAHLRFCPNTSQLTLKTPVLITLLANDGENPVVEKQFVFIFVKDLADAGVDN